MKESVFFGNEGLTSTSANYYANVAQEMIQAATERLNSVTRSSTLISSLPACQLPTIAHQPSCWRSYEALLRVSAFASVTSNL